MTTPPVYQNSSPQKTRQAKLAEILSAFNLESLVLNAGPSLTYLTGLHFHLSERPVLVFFMPLMDPVIVLPELEAEKLKGLSYPIDPFIYGEDPTTWEKVFKQALTTAGLVGKRNGVEPRQLRLLEYNLLTSAASADDFVPAEDCISMLRMRKDEYEITAMRKAAQIAESALTATLPAIKIGVSERDLATELTLQILRAGSDPQMSFTPIVSAGPNSANPHATPSDRKLASGDLLVIDWGASFESYTSDITRTFAIGEVDQEYIKIGEIVLDANQAGRDAAKPGIPIEDVDIAARSVIESAGYGKFFTHRTGHGLGMEGHEAPYVRAGNRMLLEAGMTFTVEPGIYLPGRNGVRIEDDIVITASGSESLTSLPRAVKQIV